MRNAKLCMMTLVEALAKMNLVYSPAKHPRELKQLADIWFKSLCWMQTDIFIQAMERHIDSGKFFPTPKEIREHYQAVKSEANANNQAALPMPERLTPAQVAENKRGLAGMRAALGRCLAMPTRGKA